MIKIFRHLMSEIRYYKAVRYNAKMDKRYGDSSKENDDLKFIWGVKSADDLCEADTCLYTMNDIDIVYDKKEKMYLLGVETAYCFRAPGAECEYLEWCLNEFGKFMDEHGYSKNKPFDLWMNDTCTTTKAETIEELYTNFKIFVDGYCLNNREIEIYPKGWIEECLHNEATYDWEADSLYSAIEQKKFLV